MFDIIQVFLDVNQRFTTLEKVEQIGKQVFGEILTILVCFTRFGNRFEMIELLQIGQIVHSLNRTIREREKRDREIFIRLIL